MTKATYTVTDGENLDDHSLDVQSTVTMHPSEGYGDPRVVASFEHYGDAVMFAHMKNREPEIKGDFLLTPNDTYLAVIQVVETGKIIANFSDDDDHQLAWVLREFPLYAATHTL